MHQQHGRTPYEILTGNTPDISEFLEYKWYQPVWYYEPAAFPEQRKHLARWIGVAHRVGQATAGFIETPFSVYQGISIRCNPLSLGTKLPILKNKMGRGFNIRLG